MVYVSDPNIEEIEHREHCFFGPYFNMEGIGKNDFFSFCEIDGSLRRELYIIINSTSGDLLIDS